MKACHVTQGSQEWLDLRAKNFTASEAPAMMGDSKYQSRDALLKMKATGEAPEVSPQQQKIFDKGHATEAMARPIVEKLIDDELFPVTALSDEHERILASFDGITMMENIVFEHKLWNQKLAQRVRDKDLEPHYYWQLEQQLLVSGAEYAIFVTSDGTEDNLEQMTYYPVDGRAQQLLDGWAQFKIDLKNYTPTVEVTKTEANAVMELPAINYKMKGLALTSNIDIYKEAALKLVEDSKKPLENDQDFADREKLCKTFKEAESKLKLLQEQVVGEVVDIDTFSKDLGFIADQLRTARLNGEKQVKQRKEEVKSEIVTKAKADLQAHIGNINAKIKRVSLPLVDADFVQAIKGKKTVKSLQEAANDLLASAKIEANQYASGIKTNLAILDKLASEHIFLFNDLQQIVMKDDGDFTLLVESRINEHKQAEEQRLEEERQVIREEEERKAQQQVEVVQEQTTKEPQTTSQKPDIQPHQSKRSNSIPTDIVITSYLVDNFGIEKSKALLISRALVEGRVPSMRYELREVA